MGTGNPKIIERIEGRHQCVDFIVGIDRCKQCVQPFERAGRLGRQSAIREDLPNPAIVE